MLLHDSFRIAQQVRGGAENRANSPGLLIEQQLYSTGSWYLVLWFAFCKYFQNLDSFPLIGELCCLKE